MKRRFFLLLLFLTWIICLVSFLSILHFINPYENKLFAVILLSLSFVWLLVWLLSIFFYIVKKIYFRWHVNNMNIIASMRQSLFIALSCILFVMLQYFSIPVLIPIFGIILFFISLELFLQSIYYSY